MRAKRRVRLSVCRSCINIKYFGRMVNMFYANSL